MEYLHFFIEMSSKLRYLSLEMIHLRQKTATSCGAACYAMITGCDEAEARKECLTRHTGTHSFYVEAAFKKRGYEVIRIGIHNDFKCVKTHLKLLSNEYYIYCSGIFISNSGRGRNSRRCHAIVIYDEKVFDPGEQMESHIEGVDHLFNRQLFIREILLVRKA